MKTDRQSVVARFAVLALLASPIVVTAPTANAKAYDDQETAAKDIPHVARASEHLTLMSVSHFSLPDIVAMAQKNHKGAVISVTPAVHKNRPVAVVLVAEKGKVVELDIDLLTGKAHK